MDYNLPNINQMTCIGGYLIPRGNDTYDAILKYRADDGRKVTIEGIISHFKSQFEIYNNSASGTVDFIFEKNADKGDNLFTIRIDDK